MRFREFKLFEASVFKTHKNQYVPGYRMMISTSQTGVKTTEEIKKQIPDYNPGEEISVADQSLDSNFQVVISPKIDKTFKLVRSNGQVIELQGSKSNIENSLNAIGNAVDASKPDQVKMPNKGDTAEALLGAAMFAKMQKRNGSEIGNVTVDDMWNIFDNLKPVSDNDYMVTSKDLGGATDKIWFRLKIKGFVRTALNNPDLRKKLTAWAMSPVNYVNSKEGTDYAEEFYKNGEPDEIGIISDGLSEQTARKSDVFTVVRDPESGDIQKELLPISLKAGAEQFAQHSGSSWGAMNDMFNKLGIDISGLQKEYERQQLVGHKTQAAFKVYSAVANIINNSITDDKSEARFIQSVSKAIRSWATSDNDSVRVVSFGSKGAFEVLRFDRLEKAMKGVQLRAQVVAGENPKLLVWDTNSNNVLIQIRTYLQYKDNTSYQRNIVEKGPLLSLVANAIENKEKTSPTKKSAVKKPAVSRTPTKKIVNPQVNAPPASSTQPPAPPLPTDNNVELVGPENI
jgi:hypothetical protein